MRTYLRLFGPVVITLLLVLVWYSPSSAQQAVRLWATLASNLGSGVSTPLTCTQAGAGCYLDVSFAGGSIRTLSDGTAAAPSLAFASDPSTGLYSVGGSTVSASVGGVSAFSIQNNGIFIPRDALPIVFGAALDTGLHRLGAASMAIGTSTPGDFSGGLKLTTLQIASGGSTTISTGVGSIRMSTVNAATNTAWIPITYAGSVYYVPAFTTNAP